MPSRSPGRFCRVVTLTESSTSVSAASKAREMVLLPAPEGAAITRATPLRAIVLLNVLHLFANLFDRAFHLQAVTGERRAGRLAAQRVGLAQEFLHQEIQLAADRAAGLEQNFRGRKMAAETIDLL